MKNCLFGLLLCVVNSLTAKDISGNTGSVNGLVLDAELMHPLEYATISLLKQENDSVITGTISNESGYFKLKGVSSGKYKINISFIGYESVLIENVNIESGNNIDLGEILLKPQAENLGEVVIVSGQSAMTYKIDRKIINLSQFDISKFGTAVDVLENNSSVTVNMDGSVSLRGSTSLKVLVDDKPSTLEPRDALNQIPANTIERIEIITNPTAKYSSEGTAGIINIILKKNKLEGFNGSVNANAGMFKTKGLDILLNLKKTKLDYYLGFNFYNQGIEGEFKNINRGIIQDTTFILLSEGNYNLFKGSTTARGGVDYAFNNKNFISFQTNIGEWKSGGETFLDYESYTFPESVLYNYNSWEEPARKGFFYNFDLKYDIKINNKGQKLSAFACFDRQDLVERNDNELYDINNEVLNGNKTKESGPIDTYDFQIDYSLPFGENQKFESGYQLEISTYNKQSDLKLYNPVNETYELSNEFSHQIEFDKDIHAAYALYANNFKKFGYQLGIRAEYTYRRINQKDFNELNIIDRLDYFPTLHLSYNLTDNQQFMCSYSRRVSRPKNWQLEPVYTWTDAYHLGKGNPELDPEYVDSYELNFLNKWKSNSFSVEVYYKKTANSIEPIKGVYSKEVFIITYENVGTAFSLGAEIMLNLDVCDWWDFSLSGNFYDYKLESNLNNVPKDIQSFNWNARVFNTFTLTKTFRAQLIINYVSPYATVQGNNQGYFMTNASLRKELFKDFNVILQGQGIFGLLKREKTFESDDFYVYNYIRPSTPIVSLSISYNIRNYTYNRRRQGKNTDRDNGEGSL